MRDVPPLTENEWRIMQELWKESPLTMRQIRERVKDDKGWTVHAVTSFLKRMETKGSVRVENADPNKLYSPVLSKKQATDAATRSLEERAYEGSAFLMASHIVSQGRLAKSEIAELLNMLSQQEEKNE